MTKNKKIIILWVIIIIFLIVSPSTVFYSLGYRIDWNTKKIVEVGGLFLKILPKNSEIYIDKEFEKKTGFLFNSVLFENLLPQKYIIEIKKDGYHTWKKTLEIKEKEVAAATNIILISQSPHFSFLDNNIQDFFVSPDKKKMILQKSSGQKWNLELLDIKTSEKKILASYQNFLYPINKIVNIDWSPDNERVLLKTETKEGIRYFVLILSSQSIINTPPNNTTSAFSEQTIEETNLISLDFLGSDIQNVSFSPADDQKIFFTKDIENTTTLVSGILDEKKSFPTIIENIVDYIIVDDSILWLSLEGLIHQSDFSGKIIKNLSIEPLLINKESEYELVYDLLKILLKEDQTVYVLDENSKSFLRIEGTINDFKTSPDFKKIAYFNNYEVGIFFLEDHSSIPRKKEYEQLFLTRFSEKINSVYWYTPYYLILSIGNSIKIIEIDNRDGINIVDLERVNDSEIFFDDSKDILYVLSNKLLYAIDLSVE